MGRSTLQDLALNAGWSVLVESPRKTVFYRWEGMVRAEVVAVFDAADRLEVVSLWHNQRQCIAHQPGVRAVAENLLRATR